MFQFVEVSFLEKSIQSLLLIGLILLVRRYFNLKSIKRANKILWIMLFIYLLIPYSILINIDDPNKYGLFLRPFILINDYAKSFVLEFGYLLSRVNRLLIAVLVSIYTLFQVYKMHKGLRGLRALEKDSRVDDYIRQFNFKRKITVLINDNIKVPVTYGVIKPKIVLQSCILADDELLKYVLIHELSHIKHFDIVFTHIKNLIVCFYWYNLFVLVASRYMEDDVEMFCDKMVIEKVGDTTKSRKEYCLSMLKLIKENEKSTKFTLKLNPTHKRMIIMRKWKKSFAGVMSFVMVAAISTTAFAEVKRSEASPVMTSEAPAVREFVQNEQVEVITDGQYGTLELGEIKLLNELRIADVDESVTLSGLSNKEYSFNMSSWTEPNHNGFVIKLSDMSCKSGVDYKIIIQENGRVIYKEYFDKATNVTVKAHNNSRYKVFIGNESTDSLEYKIKINSYIRK